MGDISHSTPSRARRRRRSYDGVDVLADLEDQFAQFRAEHPRGARVPADLRTAALTALARGASIGELHRRCGVSWSAWPCLKAS